MSKYMKRRVQCKCFEFHNTVASFSPWSIVLSCFSDRVIPPEVIPFIANMFKRKKNYRSVQTVNCSHHPDSNFESLHNLIRDPESSLRILELDCDPLNGVLFPGGRLVDLMNAVASRGCKLERLLLGSLDAQQFQDLVTMIPHVKLRELQVHVMESLEPMKQDLLQAVRKNFSLKLFQTDLFEDDQVFQTRIQFYLDRNIRLANWAKDPASVPQLLWSEAMKLALEAGYTCLFASLRALAVMHGVSLRRPLVSTESCNTRNKNRTHGEISE